MSESVNITEEVVTVTVTTPEQVIISTQPTAVEVVSVGIQGPAGTGGGSSVHTHVATDITDLETAITANSDVTANTAARHSHANKTVLDATTASFTTADESKLDSLTSGATINATDASLRDRTTHTGTQAISTVEGLQTSLNSKATPSDISAAVSAIVDSSPATLNTLNELAASLGDDPNFATTVSTNIGTKEPIITPGTTSQYYRGDKTFQTLDKTSVGLSLVPNTDFTSAVAANTAKVSFDSVSSTRLANTSGTNTGDQDLSSYALADVVVITSSDLTAGTTARTNYTYFINGNHFLTLPTCIGNTSRYTIKNTHTAQVTLAFTAGQTADGGGITLNPNASVDLQSNNTEWKIS